MSNPPLYPHQQEIIDRLRSLGTGRAVLRPLIGGNRLGLSVVRHALELAYKKGTTPSVNEVQKTDFAVLERRVTQSLMFGVRYGKSAWQGSAAQFKSLNDADCNAQARLDVPSCRSLMYYHVQHALMGWQSSK